MLSYNLKFMSPEHVQLLILAGILFSFIILSLLLSFKSIKNLQSHRSTRQTVHKFDEAQIHFSYLVLGLKREYWGWTYLTWFRKLLI